MTQFALDVLAIIDRHTPRDGQENDKNCNDTLDFPRNGDKLEP